MTETLAARETSAAQNAGVDPPPVRRRGPAPRTVLAIASLGAAVAFVDATIVNIAFPNIERSFPGTSISSLSWVLNAYNIVFAAFLVAAGRIADVLGRRRMFVFGLEVFTVASLLCAIAPSPLMLIIFRVIQALGAAFLVPSSLALVLNAFPPDRRSHGVALLSAVAAASAGLGPSLGGVLVAISDWRLVFLVNIPIGLAAIVLARRRLVESRAPGRRRVPDLAGAVIFAISIAALVLGVVKGEEWGWGSVRILGSFAVAIVLSAVFVWRCSWHRSPIVDLSLMKVRTFSVTNAMTIIAAAGFYGYTLVNVLFLTGVWQYSVLQAGLALTPGPFVAAAVAGPTSRLVQKLGPRPVLVAGGLIWGGAVMWFVTQIGIKPDFLGTWLPGIVLLGIGAGTLFPNLSGVAVASAPGESFATATGLNSVARQVGAALGVALVIAIIGMPSPLDALSAFDDAWRFAAVCLGVAGLGCLFVGRINPGAIPSLGQAARAVMRLPAQLIDASPAPRAHRALTAEDTRSAGAPSSSESAEAFLGRVSIFSELEAPMLSSLAARARPMRLPAGEWLFRRGDDGDALYVVRTGRLQVVDEPSDAVIRELGRGDALGELALLTRAPRSASVRAARASDVLAIDHDAFEDLLASAPALSRSLTRVLAGQLRDAHTPVPSARPAPVTVALVSLDDAGSDWLSHPLHKALRAHVHAVRLDGSEAARSDAGPSDPSHAAVVYGPVLDRAEADAGLVLLAAGSVARADPWTEFCIQQADRILAVTSGGPVPAGLLERADLQGCDLVARDVAPGAGRFAGWAEALRPIESHVVRAQEFDADVERLARRLTGRSMGIVLSGGGARAFSHIGVLEELLAAGLVIDRVSGVSMGAFVGALFAMGLEPDEIDARCFEEWVQRRPLGDYTMPRYGLIRGARVEGMLHRVFGDHRIEELDRSFMCGYAELRNGNLVLARSGPLWEGVGFSMNVPILAPPQVRGRDLIIDGSLVDNLPVRAMADMSEGPVIAVDVKATFERNGRPDADGSGTGAPRVQADPPPPSLGETVTRLLLLGSANTSEAAGDHADLVIKPRAEGVGLFEFHQLDAAREAGRAAARDALEATAGNPGLWA